MKPEPDTLFRIPFLFVLLDIIGTLFVALGLYDLFVKWERLLPPGLRFEHYEVTLIISGGFLMLPLIMILLELIHQNCSKQS